MTQRRLDYPIDECVAEAELLASRGIDIYQKWTCGHCKNRQTMAEKNKFFTAGKCEECNGVTVIKECNYLAIAVGDASSALLNEVFGRGDK
jgi:hypothetical protein